MERGRPPNQLRLSYITTRSPGSIMTERRLLLVEPDTEDCSTERFTATECRPGAGCGLGSTGNARLLHCKCGAWALATAPRFLPLPALRTTQIVHVMDSDTDVKWKITVCPRPDLIIISDNG